MMKKNILSVFIIFKMFSKILTLLQKILSVKEIGIY